MSAERRRKELMEILIARRNETVNNLATELNVSERTIRRDIEILSLTEPIYTKTGRYGGGVYIMDGLRKSRLSSLREQTQLIKKLRSMTDASRRTVFTDSELKVIDSLVGRISK